VLGLAGSGGSAKRVLAMRGNLPCDVNTLEKPSSIVNPKEEQFLTIVCWLVVSPPLNNISQWEGLSHILWKITNMFETTNQFGLSSQK